jgi:hypothetical protein
MVIMPLFSVRSTKITNCSEGYIEHLRTVHFALIIAAITGLFIVNAPDLEELQEAPHKLRQIREVIGRSSDLADGLDSLRYSSDRWMTFAVKGRRYAARALLSWATLDVKCWPLFISTHESKEAVLDKDLAKSLLAVDNLDAFRQTWDLFNCTQMRLHTVQAEDTILILYGEMRLSEKGAVLSAPKPQTISFSWTHGSESDLKHKGFEIAEIRPLWYSTEESLANLRERVSKPHTGGLIQDKKLFLRATSILLPAKVGSNTPARLRRQAIEPWLEYSVQTWRFSPDPSTSLLTTLHPDWTCKGTFEQCFTELNRSAQGKMSYPLKELSESIDYRLAHEQAREFSLFGIKPPSADQSYWAIIAILAVLTYLWLHLHHLSPKSEEEQEGFDVAWVGTYGAPAAYILIWLSTFALPVYSVSKLGLRGIHYSGSLIELGRQAPWQFVLWLLLPCLYCTVLAFSSCLMMYRLAKYITEVRTRKASNDTTRRFLAE